MEGISEQANKASLKRYITIEVPFVDSKPEDKRKAEEAEVSSEEPKKKIKPSELTKMDPLEYFSRFLGIPEMIFKYLSGKELLEASEVNPNWYDFIALSKVFMQKLKVVFDNDDSMHPEGINLVKNSLRLYQSIVLRRSFEIVNEDSEDNASDGRDLNNEDYVETSELDFFREKTHDWKEVSLDEVYFRNKLDLFQFYSSIASSVESVIVKNQFKKSDEFDDLTPFEALKFPKLKQLKLHFKDISSWNVAYSQFLLKSVSIEKLWYEGNIVAAMITKLDKLTSLTISSEFIYTLFFYETWKLFNFKLKSLTLDSQCRTCPPHVQYARKTMWNFLETQIDHLEELSLTIEEEDKENFDIIMKMPKLKSLSLTYFRDVSETEVPNAISSSITHLKMLYLVTDEALKLLLDSMPNVRKLELYSIDEKKFEMLKSLNRKFEELTVFELREVEIKELEEIVTDKCLVTKLYVTR